MTPELDPETEAASYLKPPFETEHGANPRVADAKAALEGARQILMDRFAEDAELLGSLRTGVKVAVVDRTGKLVATATVYPHVPKRVTSSRLSLAWGRRPSSRPRASCEFPPATIHSTRLPCIPKPIRSWNASSLTCNGRWPW